MAWAGCVVESPEYISNGLVTFHFNATNGSHTTSASYSVGTTQTYAQVSNVQLKAATTYKVYASCTATNGSTVTSPNYEITTAGQGTAPSESWLELPAADNGTLYPNATEYTVSANGERNYTIYYDKSTYTSMWVAYPLESRHMGDLSRPSSWSFNPLFSSSDQVDLCSSSYEGGTYSRGHLIPNASRNGIALMQKQTFYVTNSVPQLQTRFNDGIWNSLEQALQGIAKSEKIYIVTGVAFEKAGESKTIKYIQAKDDTKDVPIPNYFYKVVLKVTTNGSGTVTAASTIGFWFENKAYTDSYTNYSVSVDQIEAWTGFDFFANLPDNIENSVESNSNWSSFQSF